MVGSQQEWQRYERWNRAIATVVYSPAMAGRPAYLDLEDDVLRSICGRAEPDAPDPASALIQVVKSTLDLGGRADVLGSHLYRLDQWHGGTMLEPPPTLGVLALLSVVAERMRRSADMRAHNFYGRLAQLATMDPEQLSRFETSYRRRRDGMPASRELWESLNDWLEMCEGARGLPTAAPIGHEHIGYPLSQALVRQADREKFLDLFVAQGLAAGVVVSTAEMELEIDEWLSRTPCPASNALEHIWREQPAARRLICDAALLALEKWDGSLPAGVAEPAGRRLVDNVRLLATIHRFPRKRLSLSIAVAGRTEHDAEQVDVLGSDGSPVGAFELVPRASGWLGLDEASVLDASSFLESEVHLRRRGAQGELIRRPRRVVTLCRDDLLMGFVESDRVQLGADSAILCRSEESEHVRRFLVQTARPGFERHADLEGLPVGWVFFEGVEIISVPAKDSSLRLDLYRLLPFARAQSALYGGIKLPGNLPKWLTGKPPELRVSVPEASFIEIALSCRRPLTRPAPEDRLRKKTGSVCIWDLVEEHLPDGDYELTTFADGAIVTTELLRLRSSDNPATRFDGDAAPITNDPGSLGFAILATPSASSAAFQGVPATSRPLMPADPPSVPNWWGARRAARGSSSPIQWVSFPQGAPPCMGTGAHVMRIESWMVGMRSYEGVCRDCGLTKRYPATWRGVTNKRRRARSALEARVPLPDLSGLPRIRLEHGIDWQAGFDAVCHVGSGAISALERIAAQLDTSNLFADVFLRRLEMLAHIEVERSPTTLAPVRWRVNDPMLLGLPSGKLVVTGFRSERVITAVEDEVYAIGGELRVEQHGNAPPIIKIVDVDEEGAQRVLVVIDQATRLERGIGPARYVPDAARRLASILPSLSACSAGLPVTTSISAASCERWNPSTARFEPTTSVGSPGAFRLNGHGRRYVYRRAEELGTLQATLGDARIVKYIAAAEVGASLIGYDVEAGVLYAPLGAELPGLYGRAAALASGKPPEEDLEQNLLAYHQVPGEVAAQLNRLLMS